jgi:hypothetical protein
MGAQVADAQWVRGGDQLAEHALALRQMTHPVGQLLVDAHRDEGTQSATGAEYAQRSVAGVDQARRRLRDLMERRVQVQAGGHAEEGIEQVLHPLLGTGHRREAVLHLGEQLRQPHPGQGGADPQLAVIAGGGGRGPGWLGHRRIRFSVRARHDTPSGPRLRCGHLGRMSADASSAHEADPDGDVAVRVHRRPRSGAELVEGQDLAGIADDA